MRIETPTCVLRPWEPRDRIPLVRNANSRAVWRNLRDRFPHPYTDKDAESYFNLVAGQSPVTSFAIEAGGHAAGGIGLEVGEDVHRLTAEIGYWLGENYWGRGIMTDAVRAVTDYALAMLGARRIFAGVFAWNPASMRVLEKAGYEREGVLVNAVIKDGEVIDQVLYAITR